MCVCESVCACVFVRCVYSFIKTVSYRLGIINFPNVQAARVIIYPGYVNQGLKYCPRHEHSHEVEFNSFCVCKRSVCACVCVRVGV